VVLLLAGGGVVVWKALGGTPRPGPSHSPQPVALPTASPINPGREPPLPGNWPADWPKFTGADSVRRVALEGLGFEVTLPASWNCTRRGSADRFAAYDCGTPPGTTPEAGGELLVRACAQPCDDARQTAMRKAEEAWGQQWHRASRTAAYAEAAQVDGVARYGLVVVGYWHSVPSGPLDRQVVLRMTAPPDQAAVLRKVANSVRVGAIF